MTRSEPITVVGLGNLGRALAEAFLRGGHQVTVWNRSPGRAGELVAAGATEAETAAEAVAAGELVVVALLDSAVVREVLAGVAVRGRTLVNLTSGDPAAARELADWAAEHGAEYLHGAVYAVPQTIGTDRSSVNYSGSARVYERWGTSLGLLGKRALLGADAGLASAYDVAVLAGMYGLLGGFLHAAAMGRAAGIKAGDLTPKLVAWLEDLYPALDTFAGEIDSGRYAGGESSLDMNRSGLGTVIEASESQGVPADLLVPLKALIDRQVAAGYGADSLARAVESIRRAG